MPRMTLQEKYERYYQAHRDGHKVFRTRKAGGMTVVTSFSHCAGEEPPEDMKHLYAQARDGAWLLKGALEREQTRERELGIHQDLGYRTPADVFYGDQEVVEGDSKGSRGSPEKKDPITGRSAGILI